MARKKKLTADLTLLGEQTYNCEVTKDYTETFVLEQEVSNGDGFILLSSAS